MMPQLPSLIVDNKLSQRAAVAGVEEERRKDVIMGAFRTALKA